VRFQTLAFPAMPAPRRSRQVTLDLANAVAGGLSNSPVKA
jgi:hypothetical protein